MTRHAIVLAAGAGRRFGGGKLLAPWKGRPLVLAAVETALASPVDAVTVVVGCRADEIREALGGLGDARLGFVVAEDWDDGLSASLKAGVAALPVDASSLTVFLGDMPEVGPASVGPLLDAVEAGAVAARLEHADGPAHPIVFSRGLFADILKVRGDRGARALLEDRADVAVFVTTDDNAILDIDHIADLSRQTADGPTCRT